MKYRVTLVVEVSDLAVPVLVERKLMETVNTNPDLEVLECVIEPVV